jgi:hypothetical protein
MHETPPFAGGEFQERHEPPTATINGVPPVVPTPGFMSIGWFWPVPLARRRPPLTHPDLGGRREHRRLLKRLNDLN